MHGHDVSVDELDLKLPCPSVDRLQHQLLAKRIGTPHLA